MCAEQGRRSGSAKKVAVRWIWICQNGCPIFARTAEAITEANRMSITDGTWLVIFGFCIGVLVGAFIGRLK